MRVLVTGGAGFIGHHVVKALLERGDTVVSLDRLDTSGTLCRLAEVRDEHPEAAKRLVNVWHDLRAPVNEHVDARIGHVDYVLHLAAATHVDRSIDDPLSFVYDNVVGTANLLEFVRTRRSRIDYGQVIDDARAGKPELRHHPLTPAVMVFSTDEVFGPAPEGVAYKEDDRYRAANPYAATKAGAEQLGLSYHNTYGMPVIVTHTMNVIGKRQAPEKFVPLVIKRALEGQKVLIHADKTCTKPGSRFYIDAEDVAEAVLFLMEHGTAGELYNIVGQRELDNLQLAQCIAEHVSHGKDSSPHLRLQFELVDFHSSRPGHDLRYALDGGKLAKLGWQPNSDIERQIGDIVRWTLDHPQWLS